MSCGFTKQTTQTFREECVSEKAQEASYLVAELIAQKIKIRTIAESLIMPACKIIVRK
jgi:hypothetical protein